MGTHSATLRNCFAHRIAVFAGMFAAVAFAAVLVAALPSQALAEPSAASKQAEAEQALVALDALQADLNAASDAFVTATMMVEEAQGKMEEAQTRIDECSERIVVVQDHLANRVRSMYRSGAFSFLDVLLGSASFKEFSTAWDMLGLLNDSDADMIGEVKSLRAEVEEQKAEYERQKEVAESEAEKARQQEEEAQRALDSMQATYDALSAEAAALLEQERAARENANAAPIVDGNVPPTGGNAGGSGNVSTSAPKGYIASNAYSCLGKPYEWAAVGPDSFDCSGLVSYCILGRPGRVGSSGYFASLPDSPNPQPGDIVVEPGHVGVYIGGGQMIHAPEAGDVVKISPVKAGSRIVRY